MNTPLADINILRQKITDETIKALGLSPSDFVRKFISPIVFPATHQFAKLAAHFDHYVAKFGFSEAARWVLPRFVKDLTIIGADNVPEEGPLLVVSNHPGTVDVLAIAAGLSRDDIKIVSSAIPFIKHLPNTAQHLIFTTIDTHERMAVIRTIIRSLEEGRALLIFPSGGVDPDPAFMPEAIDSKQLVSKYRIDFTQGSKGKIVNYGCKRSTLSVLYQTSTTSSKKKVEG